MKVLTLNPPFLPRFSREARSPAIARSGTLYYPMWLAYATGNLEKAGNEVLLIDAPAINLSLEQVIQKAIAFNPKVAVLDTSTPSIYNDIEVAIALKKAIPSLYCVLVGVHVSALPEQTLELNSGIDAVAFGEYDQTLVELVNSIPGEGFPDDTVLSSIDGIAFRSSTGEIVKNRARPYIEDLDSIPFVSSVYKKHLDIKPYFYSHSRHPLIVMVTGRGCPFHLTICVCTQTFRTRYEKVCYFYS